MRWTGEAGSRGLGGKAAIWRELTPPGQGRPVCKVDLSRDEKAEGEVYQPKEVTVFRQ